MSELSKLIEDKCHDGPFGPVEIGVTEEIGVNDNNVLVIYHLKVHSEYQGHGYGKDTIKKIIGIIKNHKSQVDTIAVNIGGGDDTCEFLKRCGFKIENMSEDGSVSASAKIEDIEKAVSN